MTAPNHVIGSLTVSSIFASFWNVNLFSDWKYIVFVIFVSLLPDADHTRSILGKVFYPVAKWIQRKYGHRTITHTLLASIIGTLFSSLLGSPFGLLFFLSYFTHILLDMLTIQGVPLFYPFMRNPCVIPQNPKLRFRTGDLKTETLMFSFFLMISIFSYPLVKNGFWLSYNKAFGTMKHLHSQFLKSDELLQVQCDYRKGSETFFIEGFCIESSEAGAVILNGKEFFEINESMIVEHIEPFPTNKKLYFKERNINSITVDSFNNLINQSLIKSIDFYANQDIRIHTHKSTTSKKFKGEYVNDLVIMDQEKEVKTFKYSPRIKTLEKQIIRFDNENETRRQDWELHLLKMEALEDDIRIETDYIRKEEMINVLQELEARKKPKHLYDEIEAKTIELQELIQSENQRKKEFEESNKIPDTIINGTFTEIIIK